MTNSADRHHHNEGYDSADFGQEFLRRNPEYRAQYPQLYGSACMRPRRALYRNGSYWGLSSRVERIGKPCDLPRLRTHSP